MSTNKASIHHDLISYDVHANDLQRSNTIIHVLTCLTSSNIQPDKLNLITIFPPKHLTYQNGSQLLWLYFTTDRYISRNLQKFGKCNNIVTSDLYYQAENGFLHQI